jgi:dipeptidyl aminopeptidase/acylaminoacyl peptidase
MAVEQKQRRATGTGMQPGDVFELTGVADPRLSPDGSTVAYSVWWVDREENKYRSTIWTMASDGSQPRQFTSGDKFDGEPRWSPDGTQLAFTSSRERDAKQLYVIPAGGGEGRRLTDLKEDVSEVVWSPDGTRIAFSARVRDEAYEEEDERKRPPRRFTRLQYKLDDVGWTGDRRRQLFVVPADGSSEPTQLTSGDFEHGSLSWSPDGKRLVFVSNRSELWDVEPVTHIYLVSAEGGGEPEQLTHGENEYDAPVFSPDGSQIACRWAPGGYDHPYHGQIAVVDPSTGEHRLLTTSLDRNCSPYPHVREPIWDGEDIVFGVEDHGNTHLYRVAADGSGEPRRILEGELNVTGYDLASGTLVYAATTPTAPPELYRDGNRLTDVTQEFAEGRELVEPERFTAISADGSEVDAWIVRPAGFEEGERYPVLLSIHGGPFTQYGNRFLDEFQVYAGAGYAVLFSNPRGSSGYSEEWGRAIRGPGHGGPGWGKVDFEDVLGVVDTALERFDFLDPDRLGVLGGSYGGFMTSWIVGHDKRFRAACSERAVNNFVSFYGSSDIGWAEKAWMGVWPFEEVEPYLRFSPASYATEISTPLLIMHSEQDLRCNIEQGEHLFTTLRLLQREVEFVRFPAESHELSRSGSPTHRQLRFEILLDWFGRYLQPNGANGDE